MPSSRFLHRARELGAAFWASLGVLLFGLLLAAVGTRAIYQNRAATNWPTVDGRVVRSGMDYGREAPSFELTYTYSVDGRAFEGYTDDLSDYLVDGHSRYRSGAHVVVHYDPASPKHSVVQPAFHFSHLVALLGGLLMFGFGVWGVWDELFGIVGLWPGGPQLLRPRPRRLP